jgi:hypothetical protein
MAKKQTITLSGVEYWGMPVWDYSKDDWSEKNVAHVYIKRNSSATVKGIAETKVTYKIKDTKIATVSKYGKITAKKAGVTHLTVTAAGTSKYKKATKDVIISVQAPKTKITSIKSTTAGTLTVKWKKVGEATNYQVQIATSPHFNETVIDTVSGWDNSWTSYTKTGLKKGKTYYVCVGTVIDDSNFSVNHNQDSIESSYWFYFGYGGGNCKAKSVTVKK